MIGALAQLLSTSALAGTRSSLTLLGLGLAARLGLLAAPAWMTGNLGLALLLSLAVVEELAEQDEDLQALLDSFAHALRGGAGALAAAAIHSGGEWLGVEMPAVLAIVLGAVLATATHHLRAQLHQTLSGLGDSLLSPRTWLAWLELGGVVGLLAAIVLAPVLAAGFVVVAGIVGVAATGARRAAEDRLYRRDCPHCGKRARVEARKCPHCRGVVELVRERRGSL